MTSFVIFLVAVRALGVLARSRVGELQVVDQERYPWAAALDGSPPVYYVSEATTGRSTGGWVVFLDGGDFCGYGDTEREQLHDCYERSKTDLGSSRSYLAKPHLEMDGLSVLFDARSETNPLAHAWNWVYIPYLDGGYYAGRRGDTPMVNGTELHFRGAFNIEAIIGTLVHDTSFGNATDVVLTGCSSGGVAVIANADHLYGLVNTRAPSARVRAFVDSGYYLNANTEYWTRPVFIMQGLGSTLNTRCMDVHKESPWECIVAEVSAPFVTRLPLFASESQYDTNQLDCASIDPKNISAVNAYGRRMVASVVAWLDDAPPHTAFLDGCSRHCGGSGIFAHGLSPTTALARWYSGASGGNASPIVQPGEYPCITCCDQTALIV